jgi:hypothetical protein
MEARMKLVATNTNALETAAEIKATMERLQRDFPDDLCSKIGFELSSTKVGTSTGIDCRIVYIPAVLAGRNYPNNCHNLRARRKDSSRPLFRLRVNGRGEKRTRFYGRRGSDDLHATECKAADRAGVSHAAKLHQSVCQPRRTCPRNCGILLQRHG